jgi:hypothetical protein
MERDYVRNHDSYFTDYHFVFVRAEIFYTERCIIRHEKLKGQS